MIIARSNLAYVVAYLLFMAPTYILPYFGSNSAIFTAYGIALGIGPTPQWWAHLWCLAILTLVAWMRGTVVGKGFLPVFPVIAGFFDMTPGLSVIPLVPTVMHLVGVVMGAMGTVSDDERRLAGLRKAKVLAGLATASAMGGSILFVTTTTHKATQAVESFTAKSSPTVAAQALAHAQTPASAVATTAIPVAQPMVVPSPAPVGKTPRKQLHVASAKPRSVAPSAEQKGAATPEIRYIKLDD